MNKLLFALFWAGCGGMGLSPVDETPDSGTDTFIVTDTECQIKDIGQIHSTNALVLVPPPGVQPEIAVYLDGKLLDRQDDYYFVLDGPNVSPHGDYVYIANRTVGDHTVSVSYGCTN